MPNAEFARAEANIEALDVLAELERSGRAATPTEQEVLARWSSWGAAAGLFDEAKEAWAPLRGQVRARLSEDEWTAARRTTINAHYTHPDYVRSMWTALNRLGLDSGRVLEPGCGSGTFIGLAPNNVEMTGVELDPVTARIAAALYPAAQVRAESFADTRFPAGWFDGAVGNVPFADVVLHDPQSNRGEHSIHNHFIIKSLQLVRPGGVAAFLTSRYTMDQKNPAARREMNQLADLLGAVRLPTGAHRRVAGTEAVTDLLIFRRREPGDPVQDEVWETVGPRRVGEEVIHENHYFQDHPDHVLGTYQVGHGMYGSATLSVRVPDIGSVQLPDHVTRALDHTLETITGAALRRGLTQSARQEDTARPAQVRVAQAGEGLWEGHITALDDGGFTILEDGIHNELPVPKTRASELRALLDLRDQARALLTREAADLDDSDELDQARARLRATWERYVDSHGPINRYVERSTGKIEPETGEVRIARVRPPVMNLARRDPFYALVMALEIFDDTTQTAAPAALLRERVVVPRAPVLGVDTPAEALAVSLETSGRVDLAQIARLLGSDQDDARTQLGRLVFDDPATGDLIPAREYLSGNIATKLDVARAAAKDDDRWTVNVDALEGVLPDPLGFEEIEARLGAAWIDAATHTAFVRELLDDPSAIVEHGGGSIWEVGGNKFLVSAYSTWGTERMPAHNIIKAVLEQRVIQVTDPVGDDSNRRILNPTETEAAREKAALITERFAEWVWDDPDRGRRLAEQYNRQFNSIVLRDYESEGEQLTFPGLARTFTPRAHQRTAVARMIHEPAVGLFHEVGAGKTAEMAMGAFELRRLGLVRKPAVVVPNHMLEQFTREWLQIYPQARLLAASGDDLAGDKRRSFVARAATGDWDAIIMTRGAFHRVPVAARTEADYQQRQLDEMRATLDRLKSDGASLTIKRIEKQIAREEERLKKVMDTTRDAGITFEETGIDYLVIDEIHDYKNLRTVSNISDAAIEGSKRASDLHMKLEYLRSKHGHRVVTGATATPIANSVTEAHVMQRYMRPDLLRAAGVEEFDAWAATFGEQVTEIEMGVTGNYRSKTRFSKFKNVPEMLRMWHVFADVKTAEDLNLPTPDLAARADGVRAPVTVTLAPSPELEQFVERLGDRADMVSSGGVDPTVDNMLRISSDGRKAALDMRMIGASRTLDNKIEAAADKIAEVWTQHRDTRYRDQTGELSAVPGALQIVFCDLGTPREGWNVYDELRRQLVRRGMPAEQVRFIHEAKNDAEKGRLFSACRAGQVAVLVGSTAKMGVGTNVQARAIALHHLDCPWRPADLQQRDGRIVRQGNQNPEVQIYRWVTEKSFDAYSWQTVERKAKFIAQVMRGRLDVREIEDIGDAALSFAEVKALASGDPLVLERENAQSLVAKLERLDRAYHRSQASLATTADRSRAALDQIADERPRIVAAIERSVPTAGETFAMTVNGTSYTSRAEAGQALVGVMQAYGPRAARAWERSVDLGVMASIGGHDVVARAPQRLGGPLVVEVRLDGVPRTSTTLDLTEATDSGLGIVRKLENRVAGLPGTLTTIDAESKKYAKTLAEAEEGLGRPFKHADALADARRRLADIDAQMQERAAPQQGGGEQTDQPEQVVEQGDKPLSLRARVAAATLRPIDDAATPSMGRSNSPNLRLN